MYALPLLTFQKCITLYLSEFNSICHCSAHLYALALDNYLALQSTTNLLFTCKLIVPFPITSKLLNVYYKLQWPQHQSLGYTTCLRYFQSEKQLSTAIPASYHKPFGITFANLCTIQWVVTFWPTRSTSENHRNEPFGSLSPF